MSIDQNPAATGGSAPQGKLPCFKNLDTLEAEIRERVRTGKHYSEEEMVEYLFKQSLNNHTTSMYDNFQSFSNGIEK